MFVAVAAIFGVSVAVGAQERVWVQVEAHPSLAVSERSAERYARGLDNVGGYTLSSGWYAIAIGPFTENAARDALSRLIGSGAIPGGAFLVDGTGFRQQFFPVGANALLAPAQDALSSGQEIPVVEDVPEPDETRGQALASERQLSRPEKEALQVALQWDGFYRSAIDGAFGPGTRRAMADYQASMGYEATGVLTTRQRAELLANYRAILEGIGLETITSREAGIEMQLPMAAVSFSRFEPPFVHYTGDDGVRVLLISQEGTQATLAGLYDIMQSLEIVPLNGERSRQTSSFKASTVIVNCPPRSDVASASVSPAPV